MDESQKHNVKQKCLDIEGYVLYNSIYIKEKKLNKINLSC